MEPFNQSDFSGGLVASTDATKSAANSYPLLINGRNRRNCISPTNKHVDIAAPSGKKQGIYVSGDFLVLFIAGVAYGARLDEDEIVFKIIDNWVNLDATVDRIYAEPVPATSNLFNRTGTPDEATRIFNNTLAVFEQALFCFDGVSDPRAILPSGSSTDLGSYVTWTKDEPLYVPKGILPSFAGAKLYLASPDGKYIYHSVSGRASDFVVNIDVSGDKGGDETTVAQTVSFNPITSLRPLSTGEVLVGTAFGTFVLELDYTQAQFGEPFLNPRFLFPTGPINELSIVDVLSDTAFITSTGIHAFNAVAQAKRESNNFPFGARVRGLLTDPETEKAIPQLDGCAALYDDYAFFAVNTIFGYGAIVYDTVAQTFQSLDLSFGHVKQFAVTKYGGVERMFFITHDDKVYEAFADTAKNATRILLGEWTPTDDAGAQLVTYSVSAVFGNMRESGQAKISLYGDRELKDSVVEDVDTEFVPLNLPLPIPFAEGQQVAQAGFDLREHSRSWKIAAMVEWNFAADLLHVSVQAKIEKGGNTKYDEVAEIEPEVLAFTSDSGYPAELCAGGVFPAEGLVVIDVIEGDRYIYFANGDQPLIHAGQTIEEGIFTAKSDKLTIVGSGAKTASLRHAENYLKVLDAIESEKGIKAIIHGGDFGYPNGTELEVRMSKFPLKIPFYGLAGNHDSVTEDGKYFYNLMGFPTNYVKEFDYVGFYFFNALPFEPLGVAPTSLQAAQLKNWLNTSTKPFKFLVMHYAPYTNDTSHYPGESYFRYLQTFTGLSGILSGHAHNMERFIIDGFPYFVCGTGGMTLRGFVPSPMDSAFSHSGSYGYLKMVVDPLTCQLTFKDTEGNELDRYSIYA